MRFLSSKWFKTCVSMTLASSIAACGGSSSTSEENNNTADITAPVLTLVGESSLALTQGQSYSESGATANDDIDGVVDVTIGGSVNASAIGIYTITYTAVDVAGNSASIIRTVTVNPLPDTTAPVITLNGVANESVNEGESYTDPGASATDDVDGMVNVSVSGAVDTSIVNTYTLTYSAIDASGNTANLVRSVEVIAVGDTTPPVITMTEGDSVIVKHIFNNNPDLIPEYVAGDVTAYDEGDDAVIAVVSSGDIVDLSTIGDYSVTYTAIDSSGNESIVNRNVRVEGVHYATTAFVSVWTVTAPNLSVTMPVWQEGYDYSVDWGDGTINDWSDDSDQGNIATHTYSNTGTYEIRITGSFPQIHFDNVSPDRDKIQDIIQWGDTQWRWMGAAFWGCSNLVITAADAPDLSLNTRMNGMFRGAISFNSNLSHWDFSRTNNMASMFRDATSFNQDVSVWNVSNVTNMNFMLNNASSFDQDLGMWDISSLRSARDMLTNVTLSTTNYDALLNGWSMRAVVPNVNFHAGNSIYSAAGQGGRGTLVGAPSNWTITDAGGAP